MSLAWNHGVNGIAHTAEAPGEDSFLASSSCWRMLRSLA